MSAARTPQAKAMNQTGTSAVITTPLKFQDSVIYCCSMAKNATARGSAVTVLETRTRSKARS